MRAFLTGATGFIGGFVARALLEQRHDVTALVRTPSKAAGSAARGMAVVPGDLADTRGLADAMRGHDVVFHLAAWYGFGVRDHAGMERINVDGVEQVLRAAVEAGVGRIVYCSSVAALGNDPSGGIGDEHTSHHGIFGSFYEQTKHRAHQLVRDLVAEGVPVVTVMPAAVYGHGDTSLMGLLLKLYARRLLLACPFERVGVSMVHVDDVAHGIVSAASSHPGSEYVLAGDNDTVRGVFERVAPITGIAPPRFWLSDRALRATAFLGPVLRPPLGPGAGVIREAAATMTGSLMFRSDKAFREIGYRWRPVEEGIPPVVRSLRRRPGRTAQP